MTRCLVSFENHDVCCKIAGSIPPNPPLPQEGHVERCDRYSIRLTGRVIDFPSLITRGALFSGWEIDSGPFYQDGQRYMQAEEQEDQEGGGAIEG